MYPQTIRAPSLVCFQLLHIPSIQIAIFFFFEQIISECEYSDQQLVDNQSIRDTLCSFTLRHCRSVCCLLTACTLLQWRANQIPVVRVKEKSCTRQVHIMGCAKTGLPYMIFFSSTDWKARKIEKPQQHFLLTVLLLLPLPPLSLTLSHSFSGGLIISLLL